MSNGSGYKVGDFFMKGAKPSVAAGWVDGVYEQETVKRLTAKPDGQTAWQRFRVADVHAELAKVASAPSASALSALKTAEKFGLPPGANRSTPIAPVAAAAEPLKPKPFEKAIKRLSTAGGTR